MPARPARGTTTGRGQTTVRDDRPATTDGHEPAAYVPVTGALGRHSRWIRWALFLGAIALVALVAFADLDELGRTFARTRIWLLPLPVVCTLASLLAMAKSYEGIARAAGCSVPFGEMLKITFVANTINYVLSTGGLSGFAVRMYFLTRMSIPSNTAVVVSLAQTFMTNATLLVFILGGFFYLFTAHDLEGFTAAFLSILLTVFLSAGVVAVMLLLRPRLRRRTLFWMAQSAHWVLHRLVPHRAPPRTHVWRYVFNLNRSVEFLLARKSQMVAPFFYIVLDWVFTLLILHTAFLALRYPIRPTYVVIGFAVGIVLSFASLIPGGLGIMDGSMAAVFTGFGVPYETSVAAVLLFRAAYYVLPLLISLFFLRGMFALGRSLTRGEEQ
jgi:uncharacterized protein (TIRG00374 family)